MSQILNKFQNSRSLRLQIGILYSFLALINILFFSVMIFENQTELLVKNFKYQSENFVNTVVKELNSEKISKADESNLKKLKERLVYQEIFKFRIFDATGAIWYTENGIVNGEIIEEDLLKKAKEISDTTSIFASKYKLELNKEDFSIKFLIPLVAEIETEGPIFLSTQLSIKTMQERLTKLYYQIAVAFVWGLISHILFGIYIYRVIFTRVSLLKDATDKMATGDLKSRAVWKFNREDELDVLGQAFNGMAGKIEETIQTISTLNEEINKELKIGREVQEMFLPSNKKLKSLKVATSYRPMREVSGDIYHFYKFPAGRMNKKEYQGIFFADASGHGVSAALVTTVLIMSLENIIGRSIHPGYIIQKLGDIIGNRFQSSFFATAVFFLIAEDGEILCSNAGHNAPICFRPSTGEIFYFKSVGPPLGMVDEFDYKVIKMAAKPGDKLLIYSDGLVESPGKNEEQFTEQRVLDIIEANMNIPNKDLLDLLAEELDKFAIDYRDDVSMILVEIP
ncbi:MAG: SpoIIE family protein phosphatase [Leptospiraceae bacterium]|nr:SpoIIE family protein phosphatase [Leptospiraceae bacterium]